PALLAAAAALLVAFHTFLLLGCGHDLTREGNVARAVDLALLRGHLWKSDWDPEGIVSTLTATATFLTGILAGRWLTAHQTTRRRLAGLLLAGAASAAAGQLLSGLLPVNKNLWTGTYVLLTSGLAAVTLALCAYLVDEKGLSAPDLFLVF